MASECYPTYGELIDLLEVHSDAASLKEAFNNHYPSISIPRADRFLKTCQRLAVPCKNPKHDLKIEEYRERLWKPRVRNLPKDVPVYPEYLSQNGLTEALLVRLLDWDCDVWEIPDACQVNTFYSCLHPFLKIWDKTKTRSKTSIGQFYTKIDPYLRERGFRADNAYRFVERMVLKKGAARVGHSVPTCMSETETEVISSDVGVDHSPSDNFEPRYDVYPTTLSPVTSADSCNPTYQPRNVDRREKRKKQKIHSLQDKLKDKDVELRRINVLSESLQERVECVSSQLSSMCREKETIECSRARLQKKLCQLELTYDSLLSDFLASEDLIESLKDDNDELQETLSILESKSHDAEDNVNPSDTTLQTKIGKSYSPAIRKLYYTLLSNQVPASNVSDVIKTVLECFLPEADVKLPKARCAGYMRREELATVGMAHKAHVLCGEIQTGKQFHLNSDGTTKNQRKINGVAINGLVLSLNEVSDGSAETVIEDIEKELTKLREAAQQLGLPNANAINWTLFASSSSDSASTQKKFNRLLEERIKLDEEKYGASKEHGVELVKNFCAMHLGVNLRKAFVQASSPVDKESSHQYTAVDSFVHEFVKEFGKCGTPEYCAGSIKFPDFLHIQATCSQTQSQYYRECCEVHLERQVGSRYFVTAANASRAFFLAPAALEFLRFNGVTAATGNKLEKDLYVKLQDSCVLASLKADALMFYFVYADLVSLAKSTDLNKSVCDMGEHYLELKVFLQEVEKHPEAMLDRERRVFSSEPRLYDATCTKLNHRLKHTPVWNCLFKEDNFDDDLLTMLSVGAAAMKQKLVDYASSQLPGGQYWQASSDTKSVLSMLKPTNDLCESILGLNDYLTTAIPNMDQLTRSNMVGVKKNKTMKWFKSLPVSEQDKLTTLAMKNRRDVSVAYKEEESKLQQRRMELMLVAKERRDMLEKKAAEERERLSALHIITSVAELEQCFRDIDESERSVAKKKAKKLAILKEQVSIRKKLLNQRLTIKFSHHRKSRPLDELVNEMKDIIRNDPTSVVSHVEKNSDWDPLSLVGRRILHKFIEDDREKWWEGFILGYNCATRKHEVAYLEEEDTSCFDLTDDIRDGDLKILDD